MSFRVGGSFERRVVKDDRICSMGGVSIQVVGGT